MTVEGRLEIRRAFIAGTTRRVRSHIVDKDTSEGFQPDTLTLSIYDVDPVTGGLLTSPWVYRCSSVSTTPTPITVSSTIVNGRNDVDVIAFVDTAGNVEFDLTPEDTAIDVPTVLVAHAHQRVLLLTWTWASGKVGKQEIILSIVPDRETVAT